MEESRSFIRNTVGGSNTLVVDDAVGTVNGCIPSAHNEMKHIRFPNNSGGGEYEPRAMGEEGLLNERDVVTFIGGGWLLNLP